MFRRRSAPFHGIEDAIGYRFRDPERLKAALTHRSFRFENRDVGQDNQRMEFLGDAVLGLLLADWVYQRYEEHSEGMLTILRSRVASTVALAAVARDIGLGPYLRLGHGEAAGGGSDRESILADAMEALLAALYLDGGLQQAERVFRRVFASCLQALDDNQWAENPKGYLQNIAQRDFHEAPAYTMLAEEGPHHARTFRAEVQIGSRWRAEGTGHSKQSAQVAAARSLLALLEPSRKAPAQSGTAPNS